MINDSSDRKTLANDVNTARVEMNADDASFFTVPPVNKLDADQYIVQDLDGSGESLYGSGNLNHLTLQASQADALLAEQSRLASTGGSGDMINSLSLASGALPVLPVSSTDYGSLPVASTGPAPSPLSQMDADNASRSNSSSLLNNLTRPQSPGNSSNTTTESSSASSTTTTTTQDGNSTTTVTNTTNNNSTTTNHYHYPETNLFDTVNNTVDNVSNVTNHAVTNIFDTVNNTTDNVTDIVNNSATHLFDTVNHVVDNAMPAVNNVLETVTSILDNDGGLPGLLPQNNPGDTDLGVHTGIGAVDGLTAGVEALPLVSVVEDVIGDTDNALQVGLGIIGTNDTVGPDTDLTGQVGIDIVDQTLAGTQLEVHLDPVEALVGDIDVDLASASDLLGAAADPVLDNGLGGTTGSLVSPIGDLLSDIGGNLLPQGNDSDLNIDLGIGIADASVADVAQSVNLDVVEQVIGHDIDIDLVSDLNLLSNTGAGLPDISQQGLLGDLDGQIADALNVLNQAGDPLGAAVSGQAGIDLNATLNFDAWTQSPLPDANNVLSSVLDQLANAGSGGGGNAIPEPVGSLSEGLGGLFNIASHGHGGGHHGGLFG